jgi:hypothetical protein
VTVGAHVDRAALATGAFRIGPADVDDDLSTLRFHYEGGGRRFVETVALDGPLSAALGDADGQRLVDLLRIVLAPSYFKVWPTETVEIDGSVDDADLAVADALFGAGLAEYYHRNGFDPSTAPVVEAAGRRTAQAPGERPEAAAAAAASTLVPLGGGKDSALTLELLRDEATSFNVNPTPVIHRLAEIAQRPLLLARRSLDPGLADATRSTGLNGHVPVTAMNAGVALVAAARAGLTDVAVSAERSADQPTLVVDGIAVNHQYSKSHAFERLLATKARTAGLTYYSATRELSELAIAGLLVADPLGRHLAGAAISCNRAFRTEVLRGEVPQRRCLECAKCVFSYLVFAPFLTPAEAAELFGAEVLDANGPDAVRELWHDEKPFDCVGEREESAAALVLAGRSPAWDGVETVSALRDEAAAVLEGAHLAPEDFFRLEPVESVPQRIKDRYEPRLAALVSDLPVG